MTHHFVRLSQTELLIFYGFIKEKDNLVTLLDKYSKGEMKMYRCYDEKFDQKSKKEDTITP